MKLAVAMPAHRPIDLRVLDAHRRLFWWLGKEGIDVVPIDVRQCPWLENAFNIIMHEFVSSDAEHVVTLDDDVVFLPDAFAKLLESDRDVVGGNYRLKCNEVRWVCNPMKDGRTDGVYRECNMLGLGFARFSRKAIADTIAANHGSMFQWGSDVPSLQGQLGCQVFASALQQGIRWDPDAVFFNRLRAAGYTPWLDTSIKLGHVGTHVYEAP